MAVLSTLRGQDYSLQRIIAILKAVTSRWRSRLRKVPQSSRLLAALGLVLSIILSSYTWRRLNSQRQKDTETGRRLLRRNSGIRGKDGSRTIFVPYRNSIAKVVINPTKETTFDAHRRLFLQPQRPASGFDRGGSMQVPPLQTKPGLNLAFLHQFLSLLSIMIPRWHSKETGLLLSHAVFLMFRTYLSLVVARLDGALVRDLVAGNGKAFIWGLVKWCGLGTLAAYTNAAIKFLKSKVSIAFRTRLTRYIHDLYLHEKQNYYKLIHLDGGIGPNPDQFITQDVTLFCNTAASLYSSLGKPFVDLCVFNYQLYRSLGPLAFTGLFGNYFLTATLLRKLSPPFGKLKAVEGRKEGYFRFLHSRLIANAEEIAFYGGERTELTILEAGFKELKNYMETIYRLKAGYNMLEDFILKYSWSAFGYLVVSLPIFMPAWGGLAGLLEQANGTLSDSNDASKLGELFHVSRERSRMKVFITNKRLMLSLADAGGRLMYSIKDLSELAGYTSRVFSLISTLHRVHAAAYFPPQGTMTELFSLADIQGTIHRGFDGVRLENVPIVAPGLYPSGGDEIISSLSFIVRSGEHLLITGANGVGKTSISRVIAGLWPAYRGLVSRPRYTGSDGIMFLPQQPYLTTGTLRDQVIYPHTIMEMEKAGLSDAHLQTVLDEARLGYLPDREGGWDTRKDWKDVLSGGEKQRMAFARLFYHEPKYAVIDEGTSAVSSDVEGLMYERAKAKGITLITISTRVSLKRYHTFALTLSIAEADLLPHLAEDLPPIPEFFDAEDGGTAQLDSSRMFLTGDMPDGGDHSDEILPPLIEWSFQRIGTRAEQSSVEKELTDLKAQLQEVERWKERKVEIESELAKVWVSGGEELSGVDYENEERSRTGTETVPSSPIEV